MTPAAVRARAWIELVNPLKAVQVKTPFPLGSTATWGEVPAGPTDESV
jgi:hypothetical protein